MNIRFKKLMLKQVSEQISQFNALRELRMPNSGWLRTIRSALGMSMSQLGDRLNLSQPRIHAIEKAEVNGTITLNTMKKVADALNCELAYALLPRKGLEVLREQQARSIAEKLMDRVSHTMALEKQEVSNVQTESQLQELISQLLNEHPNKLWELDDNDIRLSRGSNSTHNRRSGGLTPASHHNPRPIK